MRASVARLALVLVLVLTGALVWQRQLILVESTSSPRPLALLPATEPLERQCDVVLPAVPVGMTRVRSGSTPLLIHYWAPWERHGRAQAAALDSLVRVLGRPELHVVLVTSDPFPSVARFVMRQRLKLRVLLDGEGALRAQVPRPRLPHTVLIGRDGRIWARQSGEVDWLSPETRATLEAVLEAGSAPRDSEDAAPEPGATTL